jgi:hypothetical protein
MWSASYLIKNILTYQTLHTYVKSKKEQTKNEIPPRDGTRVALWLSEA